MIHMHERGGRVRKRVCVACVFLGRWLLPACFTTAGMEDILESVGSSAASAWSLLIMADLWCATMVPVCACDEKLSEAGKTERKVSKLLAPKFPHHLLLPPLPLLLCH
jgi:hypothetical protein